MISDVIFVSSSQDQTELVMNQAERVAAYQGLSHKGALHLRLLSEEMMSMMRAIAGEVDGDFWIENQGEEYELHLSVRTVMDSVKREQLLATSTSGKNEANRGLMGKIRAFFEPLEDTPAFFHVSPESGTSDMFWSMNAYEQMLQQYMREERVGASEAWDELEKSVVAHLADEVKVSIRSGDVEMTVYKKLN